MVQYGSARTRADDMIAIEKNAWNGSVTSMIPNRASGGSRLGDGSTPMMT